MFSIDTFAVTIPNKLFSVVNSKWGRFFFGKGMFIQCTSPMANYVCEQFFDMGSMFFLTCTDNCPSRGEIPKMLLLARGNACGKVVAIVAVSLCLG